MIFRHDDLADPSMLDTAEQVVDILDAALDGEPPEPALLALVGYLVSAIDACGLDAEDTLYRLWDVLSFHKPEMLSLTPSFQYRAH